MILNENLFQDYDTEMNQSSAVYHCDTAAQQGTVSKLEALAKKLGVPLRFGTAVGKSPQTIILDYKYQDCAVSVNSNGSFEINGEEFGSYDSYFSFSRVNIDDVKDALLSLKAEADESEESLTESEESSSEFYGVFEKGGSIGKSYATRDDLQVWSGRDAGTLVKVFSSSDEAKNYAKRMRSMLSPGERSYYGMGYFVKKLSKKNLEHPQVIDMISNMPRSSASQVDKESMNESAEAVKHILQPRVTERGIKPFGENEKLPRGFRFKFINEDTDIEDFDDDDDMSWQENVPLYREDRYSDNYIELNDHNIFNRLDFNGAIKTSNDETIFYEVYTYLVNAAAEKFERITGVPIYLLGRSGRHVCVELNKENAKRFDELQDVQEKLEKEFIDEVEGFINNFELKKNRLN